MTAFPYHELRGRVSIAMFSVRSGKEDPFVIEISVRGVARRDRGKSPSCRERGDLILHQGYAHVRKERPEYALEGHLEVPEKTSKNLRSHEDIREHVSNVDSVAELDLTVCVENDGVASVRTIECSSLVLCT